MKKFSKRLVSLITAAVVTSGFLGTSIPVSAAIQPTNSDLTQGLEQLKATTSEAVGGMYATNPSGVGKNKTITIDGSFSDWSEDMLVAQGVANDEPRAFNGSHEYPVYDDYALYAAWDDTNLYVGWQYANPNDVTCGQNGVGTNEAKPYNADMPQIVALDLDPSVEGTAQVTAGKYIWERTIDYSNGIDTLLYFSSKPGAGNPSLFKADESTSKFSYAPAFCTNFKTEGITYKYGDGFLPKTMMGINGIADLGINALFSATSPWTDLLKTSHKTTLDTFYEMAIPLKSLGIDKNYIESNGIGVMHVSMYGSSGNNSLPQDMAYYDNVMGPCLMDASTSHEKDDLDIISVPPARVGKASGNVTPVVKPKITSFTADKTSPQEANTAVEFNTVATSGTGALTYQYEVNSEVLSAFSSTPSFTWTPSVAGDYTVKVTVKDASGITTSSTQTYTVSPPIIPTNPITINSFTTGKVSPQVIGTAISLNASASGGTGTLQYEYIVNNETKKSYSTTSSTTWTPTTAGTYTITLNVKDTAGVVKTQTKSFTIKDPVIVNTPLKITSFKASKTSPQNIGTAITLSAAATGTGTLKYRFCVNDGTKLTVLQDFATGTSKAWTPTKAGTYVVSVGVKDSTGKTVYSKFNYTVKNPAPIVVNSITADKASPQNAGTVIKLTTSATSANTLKYRYSVYDSEGNWTTLNSFNSNNYVNWTPKIAGNHMIWVDVLDDKGNIESKLINYTVKEVVVTIEQSNAAIQYTGTWATSVNTASSGGSSKYTLSDGAKATMKFTGTGIKILAPTSNTKGIAKITIDGVVMSGDMYTSTSAQKTLVFQKSGLTNTTHTITVEYTGLNNLNSTGSGIAIDAFQIVGGNIVSF